AFLTYKLEKVGVSTSTTGLIFSQGIASSTSADAVANLFRGGVTSSVRAALTYDSRDNRLFPSRGLYDNIFVEVADDFTGSENIFIRYGGVPPVFRPHLPPFLPPNKLPPATGAPPPPPRAPTTHRRTTPPTPP